jgi:hypothetical protein
MFDREPFSDHGLAIGVGTNQQDAAGPQARRAHQQIAQPGLRLERRIVAPIQRGERTNATRSAIG